MILAAMMALGLAGIWAALALVECVRLGISFHQALLYLPIKIVYRVRDGRARVARGAQPPVIYAVSHQSRLDPALMLCLLPNDTLHILDERSAKSYWLEPWRELARTIAFNAEHVFVSRRLVRHLRGRGRLAVYLPEIPETDVKAFRIYRAVARIAAKADARIVPVFVGGARHLPVSLAPEDQAPRRLLPRLRVSVLEPLTIAELAARSMRETATASTSLFDRVTEASQVETLNDDRTQIAA